MRLILIITAFALLAVVSSGQAEDSDLPACSTAELAVMYDRVGDIYALFDRVGDIGTMDDILAYSYAHLEWRQGMWSSSPLCAQTFEIALLANQLIGDYVPLILLNSLPDDAGENPYKAGQRSGLARLEALIADLPLPSTPADAPPARTLRACSAEEIQLVLFSLSPEYGRLTNMANEIEVTVDYLAFVDALLEWRQNSLTQYPPCAESIEIAWLTSQTAGDISALFSFHFMGLSIEEMPYDQSERQGTGRLSELDAQLRDSRWSAPESDEPPVSGAADTWSPEMQEMLDLMALQAVTPSGSNWRACSANELATILDLIPDFHALTDQLITIETKDALLEYSAAMIDWRERLVFDLTHCGEVLEVAWIMSEYLGDLSLSYALLFADVAFGESPLYREVMSNRVGVPMWADILADQLAQRELGREAILGGDNLPDCTATEMDTINMILADHYALYEAAGVVETLADYVAFGEAQLAWRERNWARLPLCGDSFEYFLRMSWTNNDTTVAGILHYYADVAYDANPFVPAVSSFKERADALLNELRRQSAAQDDEVAKSSQ